MIAFFREGYVFTIPTDSIEASMPYAGLEEILWEYGHDTPDSFYFKLDLDADILRCPVPEGAVSVRSWSDVEEYLEVRA